MKPSHRGPFIGLLIVSAVLFYVSVTALFTCGLNPQPWTWWHPAVGIISICLSSAAYLISRFFLPPSDKAHNYIEVTDDEWELIRG